MSDWREEDKVLIDGQRPSKARLSNFLEFRGLEEGMVMLGVLFSAAEEGHGRRFSTDTGLRSAEVARLGADDSRPEVFLPKLGDGLLPRPGDWYLWVVIAAAFAEEIVAAL